MRSHWPLSREERKMYSQISDLQEEIETLKEENEKLKRFFFEGMYTASCGQDWDGSDIQNFAEEIKLGHFDGDNSEIFIVDIDK